jgi:hypothetical protein
VWARLFRRTLIVLNFCSLSFSAVFGAIICRSSACARGIKGEGTRGASLCVAERPGTA